MIPSGGWDVVVTAGGTIDAEYAGRIGTPLRPLAPVGPERRPVLQVVIDALRASEVVRRIVAVAPVEVSSQIRGADQWLPAGESGPDNIARGLGALNRPDMPALLCPSDLPLLTPQPVRDFTARCEPGHDLYLGIVGADSYDAAFPGAPTSQWVQLRDAGPVTISGLMGIQPDLLTRRQDRIAQVFEARKSQARMAQLLGPRLLWQWATKRLTVDAIQARGEAILGCRAQVLRDAPPALAFDIDTADDYSYADARLRGERQGPSRHDSASLV